jgi:hypothetical protein
LLPTITTGNGFTLTVVVVTAVQVPAVPVMVYTVVTVGLAVTLEPVVELNPVPGLHTYVEAPVAVSVVELPLQIVAGRTVTVGLLTTVTVVVSEFTQPFASVPVIVYCVVLGGLAVTVEPVVALKPVPGLHA